jgi:hypothetical protein
MRGTNPTGDRNEGQVYSGSEEPQNCVKCLAKEIHEDAASRPYRGLTLVISLKRYLFLRSRMRSGTRGGNSSKQLPKWLSSTRVRMYACPSGNQ